MLDNNTVTAFVLALHNKAVGCLSDSADVEIFEDTNQDRARVLVRSGDATMVTYYDGFSRSIPYRTIVKHNGGIVFHHIYKSGVRKNQLQESQSAAMTSTLADPGNSWGVSRSLVCLS